MPRPSLADLAAQSQEPEAPKRPSLEELSALSQEEPKKRPSLEELAAQTAAPAAVAEQDKTFTGALSRQEIEDVAQKFGVDADKLQNLAPLTVGVETSDASGGREVYEKAAKYLPRAAPALGAVGGLPGVAAGFAGSLVPGAVKKFATSDAEEAALDELERRSAAKQTTAGKVTDFASQLVPGLVGGVGAAKTVAGAAAQAATAAGRSAKAAQLIGAGAAGVEQAGEGALQGALTSSQGNVGQGAALGAILGAVPEAATIAGTASKALGKAVKVAAPGAGAAAGYALSDHENPLEDMKMVAAGALGGALLGGTGSLLGKGAAERRAAKEAFNQQLDQKAAEVLKKDEGGVFSRLSQKLARAVESGEGAKDLDVQDFLSQSLGRSEKAIAANPQAALDELRRRGEGFAQNRLREHVATKGIEAAQRELGQLGDQPSRGVMRWIQSKGDAGRFANELDEQYGTSVARTIQDASTAGKRYNNIKAVMSSSIAKPIDKEILERGLKSEDVVEAMRRAQTEGWEAIPENMRPVVEKLQRGFAEGKRLAEERGLKIADRGEFYVPEMLKRGSDLTRSAIGHFEDLAQGNLDRWKNIKNAADILDEKDKSILEFLSGRSVESGEDVWNAVKGISSRRGAEQAAQAADSLSAIFARKGEYPAWAREDNALQLLNKYWDTNVRGALLQEPLANMRSQMSRIAARSGGGTDREAMTFVGNWLRDMTGGGSELSELTRKARLEWATKFGRAADEAAAAGQRGKAQLLETAAAAPEAFDYTLRQIYSNVLSRPKAWLTNAMSTATVLAPQYGAGWTLKNLPEAMKDVALRGKEIDKRFAEQGLSSSFDRVALRSNIKSELAKNKAFAGSKEALDKMSEKVMHLYEYTEKLNKRVMDSLNTRAAEELVSGKSGPRELLEGMDVANRRQVNKVLAAPNLSPEEKTRMVRDELNRYSQARFLFNYDKASTSGFVRDLGPLFSTFSRWPVSVGSELLKSARDGNIAREATKYGGVWGLLSLADKAADIDQGAADSPRMKYFVGRDGFSGMAPIQSVTGVLGGDQEIFTPPIVQQGTKVLGAAAKSIKDQDPEALTKSLKQMWLSFQPGGYVPRILLEDLPRVVNDEQPE